MMYRFFGSGMGICLRVQGFLLIAGIFLALKHGKVIADDAPRQAASSTLQFSRDILPILSDNCLQCHGPDAKSREADLRLDEEASVKEGRDTGTTIVPGKRAESLLWQRITATGEDERMPPASTKRSLTKRQIELLGRWIDERRSLGKTLGI